MTSNRFRAGLMAGRRMAGLWLSLDSPAVTEMAADSGADWVLIDMEHAPTALSGIPDHLRATRGALAEPIVRVPVAEPVVVKRLLDMGARCLMFPIVMGYPGRPNAPEVQSLSTIRKRGFGRS